MTVITDPADVANLGRILTVYAHPDDETFCSGGVLALAAKNGQPILSVTATKGEAGSQDTIKWPLKTIGAVREAELAKALKIIGITDHQWLGYHDGQCHEVNEADAINRVKAIFEQFKPDSILTFASDGLTGHFDHCSVSRWVQSACQSMAEPPVVYGAVTLKQQYDRYLKKMDERLNIFFNTDAPVLVQPSECAICLTLPPQISQIKYKAFSAMPSQMETMLSEFGEATVKDAFGVEAFIRLN